MKGMQRQAQSGLFSFRESALIAEAWEARSRGVVVPDGTQVGCAVLTKNERIFSGCNIEHRLRCHDIHAEVNAISSMVAAGERELIAVLVVSRQANLGPCGSCLDWILQFALRDCVIGWHAAPGDSVEWVEAARMMPYYPRVRHEPR